MRSLEKQIRGLILKFLDQLYPDGATAAFLEGLLADWRIFICKRSVLEELRWLMDRGYVEARGGGPSGPGGPGGEVRHHPQRQGPPCRGDDGRRSFA